MSYRFTTIDKATKQVLMTGEAPTLEMARMQELNPYVEVVYDDKAPGLNYYWESGAWVSIGDRPSSYHEYDWTARQWYDPRDLTKVQECQVQALDKGFSTSVAALTSGYPEGERQTWPTQQSEALAWDANPNSPTPFLDAIAANRGITPEDMRAKTLENVKAFMTASTTLVGLRQKLRDQILQTTTIPQALAINWPQDPFSTEAT